MDLDFIVQAAKAAPLHLRQHAAREALQRCLLAALARQGLLIDVAFIGGTALRIRHQLPRYSEDLDFIWTNTQSEESLGKWSGTLKRALSRIGVAGITQPAPATQVDALVEKRSYTIHLVATCSHRTRNSDDADRGGSGYHPHPHAAIPHDREAAHPPHPEG